MLKGPWVELATNSPHSFDLPATLRLCDHYGKVYITPGQPNEIIRLVQAFGEKQAQCQCERYSNGLYIGMPLSYFKNNADAFPDYFTIAPEADQYYYRMFFNFEAAIGWESEAVVQHLVFTIERTKKFRGIELVTDDGGLTYHLTVKGSKGRFELIAAQIQAAYERCAKIATKV